MATGPLRRLQARIAILAALAAGGCVSVATDPSPTDPHRTTTTLLATTTTTLDLATSLDRYRSCLGERGVSIDEILIDGRGRPRLALALSDLDLNDQIVLKALSACAPTLANGALDTSNDPHVGRLIGQLLGEYAECIRRNGVAEFPDPRPGYDAVGPPFAPATIPWADGELGSAVTVCSALLTRSSS